MSRPYQNRVLPSGEIVAVTSRGTIMGNRGRIHEAGRIKRRWTTKAWICCALEFRGRHREVMGNGWTELFFLDEATAFAAGHRPCFQCRYEAAMRFAELWAGVRGDAGRAYVGDMDQVLHAERTGDREMVRDVPEGALFRHDGADWLRCEGGARRWSFEGYGPVTPVFWSEVEALTPRSMRDVLAAGYVPQVHPSGSAP